MLVLRAFAAGLVLTLAPSAALLTVGPGGTYAEIADAIAAAQPGDTILVAPGTYEHFEVHLPLRILGAGSGAVVVTSFGPNGVVVSGIAAGEEVVLSGVEVRANPILAPTQASILLADNEGSVLLSDVRVDHVFSLTGVYAEQCARVVLEACEILDAGTPSTSGGAAVRAVDSTLWIAGSTIRGDTAATGFAEPGDHAVSVAGGSLHVWRSTLRGGDGVSGKGIGVVPHGGDAVRAQGTAVVLYGGPAGDELRGGDGALGFFIGHGAGGVGLRLSAGSDARVQAALPITGGLDAFGSTQTPPIVTDGTSAAVLDPTVFATLAASASQTTLGGAFALAVDGRAGAFGAAFASLSTGPTAVFPGVEGLGCLDPGLLVQLPAFVLDAAGSASIPISVPPAPSLLGATFVLQAAVAGGQVSITNPVLVSATG